MPRTFIDRVDSSAFSPLFSGGIAAAEVSIVLLTAAASASIGLDAAATITGGT